MLSEQTVTKETQTEQQIDDGESREFEFPADRLEAVEEKLAKLGKRAAKLGVEQPTVTVLREFDRVQTSIGSWYDADKLPAGFDHKSIRRRVRFVKVRINGPTITVDGWTFAATVEHTDAGNAIKRAPYWSGVADDIPHKYREGAPVCEHCNTKRRRKDSFLVTDGDGGWKQIGRNCLGDFLGRDPCTAAWSVMFWDTIARDCEYEPDSCSGGGGWEHCPEFNEFIAATFHYIRKEGWLSRGAAYACYEPTLSTADLAGYLVTPIWGTDHYAKKAEEERREEYKSIKPSDWEKAEAALAWTRETLAEKGVHARSDYEQNLFVALAKPSVARKDAGILASLVLGYNRHIEEELKRREFSKKSNEHLYTIGERVHGLALRVVKFREFDSYYGARIMTSYEDDKGNSVVHWGGKYPQDSKDHTKEADVGDTVIGSWTIKKHEEYKGRKQTIVSRPAKITVQKEEK